jgi:hypothetical protein
MAYKQVRANKGAPGIDQQTFKDIENKVEKGESGVSIGNYATVLFVLRMIEPLSNLAGIRTDSVGIELEEENLPKRIRKTKKKD